MRYEFPNIVDSKGGLNSIYPPTGYLTFGAWIYLVPQYKPDTVLMLGYAGGTASGLIHLFYPNVKVTGVDIDVDVNFYDDELIKADARDYIKDCEKFDTIVVDLFDDGSTTPCEFIFEEEFAKNVRDKCDYLIVHANENSDMSTYGKPLKVLSLNTSKFYYYMVNDIPSLPIR